LPGFERASAISSLTDCAGVEGCRTTTFGDVAAKMTGLPFRPGAVALRVFGPAALPSVQLPTAAIPAASVLGVAPVRLPPPDATANVTGTPATGLAC